MRLQRESTGVDRNDERVSASSCYGIAVDDWVHAKDSFVLNDKYGVIDQNLWVHVLFSTEHVDDYGVIANDFTVASIY
jgi:hypothetical protein